LLFLFGSEKSHLNFHLHGYNQAGTLHWGSCNKGSWSKPTGTSDMFPVGRVKQIWLQLHSWVPGTCDTKINSVT
jgi:hypothetical protein